MSGIRLASVNGWQTVAFAASLAIGTVAQASFFVDEFNGSDPNGPAHPDWTGPTFTGNGASVTASESGGLFTVTEFTLVAPDNGYGHATYSRPASVSGEFQAFAEISWTSGVTTEDPRADMAGMRMELVGTSGTAHVGWLDGGVTAFASIRAQVPGFSEFDGPDDLPASGSASLEIVRDSLGVVSIFWNGGLLTSGTWTDDLTAVQMRFTNFSHQPQGEERVPFGSLSFDRIGVVPEPAGAALLMAGLGLVAGRRRTAVRG